MKEIKFRAWWKDTMEPIPDFMEQDIIEVLNNDPDNPFIFSQYTGLKDKNGKEIYEGDVVRKEVTRTPEQVFSIGTVTFTLGMFLLDTHPLGWPSTECLEVIGNIYEN